MQVVVTTGVALASYGEIRFVILGVILQVSASVLESTRLILVQVLLQVCSPVSSTSCSPIFHGLKRSRRELLNQSFTLRRSAPHVLFCYGSEAQLAELMGSSLGRSIHPSPGIAQRT